MCMNARCTYKTVRLMCVIIVVDKYAYLSDCIHM